MKFQRNKLGDVLEKIVGGGTPSMSNYSYWGGDIPWASVKDIKEDSSVLEQTQDFITAEGLKNSSSNLIPAGTIIISTRMGLGRAVRTKIDTAINQDLKALFPKKDLDPDYLLLFLKNIAKDFVAKGSGATVSGIKLDFLKSIEIPLPSLAEQKKIVAKIERAFAKIDEAARLRAAADTDASELLGAALSGVFLEAKEKGWEEVELGRITKFIDYRGKTPKKTESGLRLITAKNVKFGYISEFPAEYISPKDYDSWMTRGIPKKGDVLFTTEAPLGNVAILDTDKQVVFAQRVIILQPFKELDSNFLKHMLMSGLIRETILSQATGATAKGIKASKLKLIRVFLPPVTEQKKIAQELDALSEKVRKLRQLQTEVGEELKELKKAVLREAFN